MIFFNIQGANLRCFLTQFVTFRTRENGVNACLEQLPIKKNPEPSFFVFNIFLLYCVKFLDDTQGAQQVLATRRIISEKID